MEKTIDVIVEGGKATAGPPLGPALGPMGINTGQVVADINKATAGFAGMKIPVKVIVNTATKKVRLEVGAPPVVELLKKEAGIEKGAGNKDTPAGDVKLEAVVKIAKQKTTLAKGWKETTKEVLGTCKSMGLQVNGKNPRDVIKEINGGKHDSLFAGSAA